MTVGIIVALPEELATLTPVKLAQGECLSPNQNLIICYAGAGPINAGLAAQTLIKKGAGRLISWGCAAALSAQLKPGDLVLTDQVISATDNISSESDWIETVAAQLTNPLSICKQAITSSQTIIAASSEKQQLHQQTAAAALDMESLAIAKTAKRHDLPFLVIRAIADPASMTLPQAVVESLNQQGRVELPKLLKFLLSHPWEIPALIKLGIHFNAAQKTLRAVARQLDL